MPRRLRRSKRRRPWRRAKQRGLLIGNRLSSRISLDLRNQRLSCDNCSRPSQIFTDRITFSETDTLFDYCILLSRYLNFLPLDAFPGYECIRSPAERNVQAHHQDGNRCGNCRPYRFRRLRCTEGRRPRGCGRAAGAVGKRRSPSRSREGSGMLKARLARFRAELSIRSQKTGQRSADGASPRPSLSETSRNFLADRRVVHVRRVIVKRQRR